MASNIDSTAKHLNGFFKDLSSHEVSLIRTSRGVMLQVVRPLITQMGISPEPGSHGQPMELLDLACGTGVATHAAQLSLAPEALAQSRFVAGDQAEGMLSVMRKRVEAEGWKEVDIRTMDARNTGLDDNSFSHVAAALALHIIPDPDAVVKDSMRILKPGGTFGASTWPRRNSDSWLFADLKTAFESFPFPAPLSMPMQLHTSGHWDDAAWIGPHLRELGLLDVEVREFEGRYCVESVDEFMMSFEGMIGWIMKANWSEEVLKAHPEEEVKGLLREHLRTKYDGKGWDLNWIEIVMTGKKPL